MKKYSTKKEPTGATKRCRRCGETKPANEFAKSTNSKDGLQSYCKKCSREAAAARHKAKRACVEVKQPKLPTLMTGGILAEFQPRELINELRRRGYRGTLTYESKIIL